jgi:8-oxo-dGTP pyrophosphatase MutT (NUDIX family)
MVVIQPSTGKIVVIYESKEKVWFLPKGRKDVGESLEQAALREAYEEVVVELLSYNPPMIDPTSFSSLDTVSAFCLCAQGPELPNLVVENWVSRAVTLSPFMSQLPPGSAENI